eukprot:5798160-Amphidinium_carterae.1
MRCRGGSLIVSRTSRVMRGPMSKPKGARRFMSAACMRPRGAQPRQVLEPVEHELRHQLSAWVMTPPAP